MEFHFSADLAVSTRAFAHRSCTGCAAQLSSQVYLAAKEPARLQTLQAKFLDEANKYGVLPFDPRILERMDPKLRVAGEPPTEWTYYGSKVSLPEPIGPQLFPRAHEVSAKLTTAEGAERVVTCAGAFSAGWSLYVKEGKPCFRYTCFDIDNVDIVGAKLLPVGAATLGYRFTPDGSKLGAGRLELLVNGETAASGQLTRTLFRHGLEPFEVGRDSITPIAPAYADCGEFAFTGQIETIRLAISK